MTVTITKPPINIREKLAELDKPTGIAGEAMLRAETVPDQAELLGYRQQNVIINGDMQIAQRGTTITGVTEGDYMTDRWQITEASSAVFTGSHSTEAPNGFANSLKLDVTTADTSLAAGDNVKLRQRIEGYNLIPFASGTNKAKAHTLSFWVRSNVTGTFCTELRYVTSGLEASQAYTINSANTWEYKTVVFPAQSTNEPNYDNTSELDLVFWLAAGSNFTGGSALGTTWSTTDNVRAVGQINAVDSTDNEFYITGVQLVAGNYHDGLPFMHRSYGEELALCQRYFYRHTNGTVTGGIGPAAYYSSSDVRIWATFPVTMRATPSLSVAGGTNCFVVFSNGAADYLSTATLNAAQPNGMNLRNTTEASGTSGAAGWGETTSGVNTRIDFDAEL